jgi:hypothetical protein
MKKTKTASDANTLEVAMQPGKTEARMMAELVTSGIATNAVTMQRIADTGFGALALTDLVATLNESGKAVNENDLAEAERTLNAQAVTLNLIFGELARRAALNMGSHLGAMESYMRLALKAQAQSRATFETLAAMKNPPVVFARQANINNGGQQQVNNGESSAVSGKGSGAHTQAGNLQTEQTGLLEAENGQRLDTRAARKASGSDSHLEAVGTINRPSKRRGQGEVFAQCLERR